MIMPIKPRPIRSTRPEDNLGLAMVALFFRGHSIFQSHDSAVTQDDLCSEMYMALMRSSERFDPNYGSQFSTYAVKSMRRAAQKSIMRQKPRMAPITLAEMMRPDKCVTGESVIRSDLIEKLLRPLTPKHRKIIILRYFSCPPLTMVKIGHVVGCCRDTVRTRLLEAMEIMREEAELIGMTPDNALE